MSDDALFYDRAIRRIYWISLLLSLLGGTIALILQGPGNCLGFMIGSMASFVNFRAWRNVVNRIGGNQAQPWRASGVFLALRYLLFGIAGYVLVTYLRVSLTATLLGLLVTVAAVILEMIYELIYPRR